MNAITNLNLSIPGQEPAPVQNNNIVQAVVDDSAPADINDNTPPAVNNNVLNPLLDSRIKRLIIKEAQKIDAKLILIINKNVDKKIYKKISRLINSYCIMESPKKNKVTTTLILSIGLKDSEV